MNFKTLLLMSILPLIAVILATLQVAGVYGEDAGTTSSNGYKNIYAKSLTNHECDATEWHFVITQVNSEQNAPVDITVTFGNSNTMTVLLDDYTGKTAHYATDSNLGSTAISASADIYAAWGTQTGPGTNGQFNLSHGPCNEPTPTPTPTPCPNCTPTPTPTPCTDCGPTPTPTPPTVGTTPGPTSASTPTSTNQLPTSMPVTGGAPE